ncbi:Uncharacterized protein PECH_004394 [Penicillium ucsense]|uniref:N-acetyltransferase domain-containing protein n=1 Tax=Penicillium ucsense TaxID=2839758 RepID=A0A8J8W6A2_9EURO|nr:Uncharacterized protein PECM_005348 [Penicillium ucsense]KAF7737078.1 Uncharacterized protein PECH_004394 [Penicillium ucsense]
MAADTKVTLIPWDPQSPSHRAWLLQQRDECSWDQEKVNGVWIDYQTRGIKSIFWIVLPEDKQDSAPDEVQQIFEDDQQSSDIKPLYLRDTAQSLKGVSRQPTHVKFQPVGHISLDSDNPGVERVGVTSSAPGMFWIKTFFVSKTVQSRGVGRAAMDELELMATSAPLSARVLVLDVVPGEDQMREDFALATYGTLPKA